MTEPDRYGEEIRRALSAAADLVVPAGDGLDIIRKRAARRPPMLAWLLAYVSYLPRQLITRVRVVASEVAVMAKGESDLLPRMWARLHPRGGHARSAQAWLRPALAGAAALLLVLGVMLAVPKLRQTITNQANTATSGGPGGGAGASGQVYGTGTQSPGASGSSTAGFQSSSGLPPPMTASGPMPSGPLYLMLPGGGGGGGTVPNPCVSSTSSYAPSSGGTTPVTDTSSAGSPGTVPGGGGLNAGAPNGSAGQQNGGYTHGGAPNCGPSGTSTPTTPPTSTPPTSTPPTSTPPTSTPPTSPPPTSPSSPTSPPPTSTSAVPTDGSSAAIPAPTTTSSGS